jgi:hypothetical protein
MRCLGAGGHRGGSGEQGMGLVSARVFVWRICMWRSFSVQKYSKEDVCDFLHKS